MLTSQRLPQPRPARGGGVLVVGASASGVQIADELQPGRPRGHAGGRAAHPDAPAVPGPGHLLVAGDDRRLARTIDEMPDAAAPGVSRRCSWSGTATSPDAPHPSSTWPCCRARGVRLAGRLAGCHGRTASVRRRPADEPSAAADTGCTASSTRRPVRRTGRADPRGVAGQPAATGARCAALAARLDLRAEGIDTVLLATGYRPHHPWLRLPDHRSRTAPSVSTAASPRRRASTPSASGSSTGATRPSSTAPATTRRWSSTTCSAQARRRTLRHRARSRSHERYDVVVVGGRVAGASTALLLARAGAGSPLVDRGRRGSDTLSTHGLMRAGVLQLSRWGLLDQVVAAGTPPIRRTIFHYPDGEPVHGVDPAEARRRRAVCPSPTCSTGSWSTQPRRPARTCMHETT